MLQVGLLDASAALWQNLRMKYARPPFPIPLFAKFNKEEKKKKRGQASFLLGPREGRQGPFPWSATGLKSVL